MYQIPKSWSFYAFCPVCKDFLKEATSVGDARKQIEEHEKSVHKGKPVGTFGKQKS